MKSYLRDKPFSYVRPLVDVHNSSEYAYVKILAYKKLLKMVHVSELTLMY